MLIRRWPRIWRGQLFRFVTSPDTGSSHFRNLLEPPNKWFSWRTGAETPEKDFPMSTTAAPLYVEPSLSSSEVDCSSFEDQSPFGLQGLKRETLRILKSGFISRLAISLALRGTRDQIRDPAFVDRILSYHPEWQDEYEVIHLIEKSLWIQGRSDLVMTLTKNPAQIPDNPPPRILQALTHAYALHPKSTIWYCVPLFGDLKNEEGLPIPVTAAEVRTEAARRIRAAQTHALRWRWLYRSLLGAAQIPTRCYYFGRRVAGRIQGIRDRVNLYVKRAREDARRRDRAAFEAERERLKTGRSTTVIPDHRTWLGVGLESVNQSYELVEYRASLLGTLAAPLAIAKFAPLLITPITIMSADPFLFVELPDEPGKLRHLGHWYWQEQERGGPKLHLHV